MAVIGVKVMAVMRVMRVMMGVRVTGSVKENIRVDRYIQV